MTQHCVRHCGCTAAASEPAGCCFAHLQGAAIKSCFSRAKCALTSRHRAGSPPLHCGRGVRKSFVFSAPLLAALRMKNDERRKCTLHQILRCRFFFSLFEYCKVLCTDRKLWWQTLCVNAVDAKTQNPSRVGSAGSNGSALRARSARDF